MTTVAEITSQMESKFNSAAAAGLDLVFQFNITDDENFNVTGMAPALWPKAKPPIRTSP